MGLGQDLTLFAGPGFYRTCGTDSFMLRPGLVLQLSQLSPTDPLHMEFEIQSSPLIFGFMLTGSNHCSYKHGALSGTTQLHTSGSNSITYLSDTVGNMRCKGGMRRLSIIMDKDFLYPYLVAEHTNIPKQLERVFEGRKTAFQWIGKNSAQKIRLIADIVTSAYAGTLRKLHMEIRTLELIETQLIEYLSTQNGYERTVSLSPSDVRRIKEARELLVQDMESPPTLAQLAKMVGVGEKKLKVGFKQVFGLPVFEYFRNYRMEVARELLAAGDMNVTEIGVHIGYQSLSHFSHEFFKRYGVTPKKFQSGKGNKNIL